MSPNPDHSKELALQKGQTVVVFGDMGEVSRQHWDGRGGQGALGWVGWAGSTGMGGAGR